MVWVAALRAVSVSCPSCQSTATANDYRSATQSSGEYLFGTQSYAFGYELDASAARRIDVRMVPETAAYMG